MQKRSAVTLSRGSVAQEYGIRCHDEFAAAAPQCRDALAECHWPSRVSSGSRRRTASCSWASSSLHATGATSTAWSTTTRSQPSTPSTVGPSAAHHPHISAAGTKLSLQVAWLDPYSQRIAQSYRTDGPSHSNREDEEFEFPDDGSFWDDE